MQDHAPLCLGQGCRAGSGVHRLHLPEAAMVCKPVLLDKAGSGGKKEKEDLKQSAEELWDIMRDQLGPDKQGSNSNDFFWARKMTGDPLL